MKKLSALFFVIAFAFIVTIPANAQLLIKFSAKDGLKEAQSVPELSAMQNPKLIAIMTENYVMDYNGIPISVAFDLSNGDSEMWVYVFVDAANTTKNAFVLVINTMMGFVSHLMPDEELEFDEFFNEYNFLDEIEWKDSYFLAENLKNNSDFQAFYNESKNLDLFQVILLVNTSLEDIELYEPYWLLQAESSDAYHFCTVHSLIGTTNCQSISTSVFEALSKNDFNIYPNPAKDYINISLPELSKEVETQLSIFDIYGREIDRLSLSAESKEIRYLLNQKGFSSGMYFIKYFANNKQLTIPFIIEK